LDPNVDLNNIAKRTKNFSGAELEGLVRAAQSSAMNRLVKAGDKVIKPYRNIIIDTNLIIREII
jgi:SpoVK/Ycf46/Vps4 family AAA+-type ATPase